MVECGGCYEPGYTGGVCLCIPITQRLIEMNNTIEAIVQFVLSSPPVIFALGFAAGILFCIWLSSFMPSAFAQKEKLKNDG